MVFLVATCGAKYLQEHILMCASFENIHFLYLPRESAPAITFSELIMAFSGNVSRQIYAQLQLRFLYKCLSCVYLRLYQAQADTDRAALQCSGGKLNTDYGACIIAHLVFHATMLHIGSYPAL